VWPQTAYRANFRADYNWRDFKWKSPIFMPRDRARIYLEVVSVRAERVRDISEDDAIAEGVEHQGRPGLDVDIDGNVWNGAYRKAFESAWIKMHGVESWERDWVWVVEFKVV